MKAKKSSKNKVRNKGPQGKEQAVSCIQSVHPDVILDTNEALHNILGRLVKLEAEIEPLKAENKDLKRRNEYLEAQHRRDLNTIGKQKIEIKSLKTRLDKLEKPKKDSHNSSVPPSKEDISSSEERRQRTKSLRKPSDKKSGGQPGHKGITLQRAEAADEFIEMTLDECPDCGEDLTGVEGVEKQTRQVVDIVFPAPVVTEYTILSKLCPKCGHVVCSEFPEDVNGDVSYGPNVQALVVYLSEEHAVSYQRIKNLMNEMFCINMSEGTIDNIIKRMTRRAKGLYEKIKAKIGKAPVVGADETGIDIAGVLHWLWVWQTETVSFFKPHAKRGYKAIEDTFEEGLPNATLVTDRHAAYFNMDVKNHQICLVHLQRNLTYLTEAQPDNQWPKDMLELITDAMKQRKEKAWDEIDRVGLKKRLDNLLDKPIRTKDKEFVRMKNGLSNKKDYIFTFLDDPDVPYENNASERAVRPAKTKQKVTGLFRTFTGAEAYSIMHSIIDSAKKQILSPFNELQLISQLKPSQLKL
jgi:transposase